MEIFAVIIFLVISGGLLWVSLLQKRINSLHNDIHKLQNKINREVTEYMNAQNILNKTFAKKHDKN